METQAYSQSMNLSKKAYYLIAQKENLANGEEEDFDMDKLEEMLTTTTSQEGTTTTSQEGMETTVLTLLLVLSTHIVESMPSKKRSLVVSSTTAIEE